jgi:hypothetical protein
MSRGLDPRTPDFTAVVAQLQDIVIIAADLTRRLPPRHHLEALDLGDLRREKASLDLQRLGELELGPAATVVAVAAITIGIR